MAKSISGSQSMALLENMKQFQAGANKVKEEEKAFAGEKPVEASRKGVLNNKSTSKTTTSKTNSAPNQAKKTIEKPEVKQDKNDTSKKAAAKEDIKATPAPMKQTEENGPAQFKTVTMVRDGHIQMIRKEKKNVRKCYMMTQSNVDNLKAQAESTGISQNDLVNTIIEQYYANNGFED